MFSFSFVQTAKALVKEAKEAKTRQGAPRTDQAAPNPSRSTMLGYASALSADKAVPMMRSKSHEDALREASQLREQVSRLEAQNSQLKAQMQAALHAGCAAIGFRGSRGGEEACPGALTDSL